MAEGVVEPVVSKLILLLEEELNLLSGIHKEVKEITQELQYIQAFLKDADQRAKVELDAGSRNGVKMWVSDLREVALKVEDAIDEYTHFMAQKQGSDHASLSKRSFIVKIHHKVSRPFRKLGTRHDLSSKIQDLKREVVEINKRSERYSFSSTQQEPALLRNNGTRYDPRNDSRFLKETEMVGIQADKDELLERLVGGPDRQTVISLVGMPGIGKTTLANQVFDQAKAEFDCHAWIDVSQSYNMLELTRSLIKEFCQSRKENVMVGIAEEMDYYALARKLRDYLTGKSYFIIFDDVWDTNFWAHVKNGLPDKKGRILITTRNVEVAYFCRTSSSVHIHQMQLLTVESSWELFCNKAFHSEDGKVCPSHLKACADEVVQRCNGLPLAIVVIAGLLATKNKTVDEWKNLLSSLSYELEGNEHLSCINRIMSLSYHDLPVNLQSCFLYFGLFPEDYSISSHRLVRQWIAEGFVKPQNGKTVEVVGEEYLVELMHRSVVQVSEIDFDGKARSFRVHDLVREFILKKMEDLKFGKLQSEKALDVSRFTTRRVSFLPGSPMSNIIFPEKTCIRSIFVFDGAEILDPLAAEIASHLKLLKVLDFEANRNLHLLPENIGNLFHLRYLSVRGTRVKLVPRSVGNLANLETLDLKKTLVHELPAEINKLGKLRHLIAYHEVDQMLRVGVKLHKGFGNLKSLQKLYIIEGNVDGVNVIEEVSKLTELRKLVMSKLTSEDVLALRSCLTKLKCLESLELHSASEDEVLDYECISSPPQLLRHLWLHGPLSKFPEWIPQLQNLVKVMIIGSKLEDDPLRWLQNLGNLLEFEIAKDAYYGEKLQFEKGSFARLKVLSVGALSRLESMEVEEGALPNLEKFYIRDLPRLKEVPHGLQQLTNLKFLHFWEMPPPFLLFQDFYGIRFVPEVRFLYCFHGEQCFIYLKEVVEIQKYVKENGEIEWNSLSYEEIIPKALWKQ